ncbi:MAG: hypothetical protein VX035_06130 [Planctomycetota bacterium]|nr:hypothetical protein [Planctomycetota bacterium]
MIHGGNGQGLSGRQFAGSAQSVGVSIFNCSADVVLNQFLALDRKHSVACRAAGIELLDSDVFQLQKAAGFLSFAHRHVFYSIADFGKRIRSFWEDAATGWAFAAQRRLASVFFDTVEVES